jgi:NADPH-dependent ferric siderophore reductase
MTTQNLDHPMQSDLHPKPRAVQRVRHIPSFRLLEVVRVNDLSGTLRRITLGGSELSGFVSLSPDDHVKVFFFPEGIPVCRPANGPSGPVWPEGTARPPMRDYTPRRYDERTQELDIEFVLHGEGPAAQWATAARPGSRLLIAGPRGSALVPPRSDGYLLVADEAGLPAVASWLERLPTETPVTAILEVADPGSEIRLHTHASLSLTWVHRNGREPGDTPLLLDTLKRCPRPPGDFYAWVACESGQSREIRRFLEDEYQLDADSLKTAGYWKRGVADFHD